MRYEDMQFRRNASRAAAGRRRSPASRWLVDAAVDFARLPGVSELVIGLTVVAVGTSLPQAANTVVAAALHFDIPVMTAAELACLPIFFTERCIERWEGLLFLGC